MLCCSLWAGSSALAAELPVQVSAQLTESTVTVTGTVQDDTVARVGVLILDKDTNLDDPSPEAIVYVNEYELGAEKDFSFEARLPEADLQQYVLRIGSDNGLLYQRLLDGSEIPGTSDTTSDGSSTTATSPGESESTGTSQGTTSGTLSGETTLSTGTAGTGADQETQPVSPEPSSSAEDGESVQTGVESHLAIGVAVSVAALLVLGAAIIGRKKEGKTHE